MPTRDPFAGPGADPANDPLSTPGPTATPTEDPSCAKDVGYLIGRAETIHRTLLALDDEEEKVFKLRTTAVLRIKTLNGACVDMVGSSGKRVLEYTQRLVMRANEVEALGLWGEAEENVIKSSYPYAQRVASNWFVALGVSRNICEEICQPLIRSEGGTVLPSLRGAVWP